MGCETIAENKETIFVMTETKILATGRNVVPMDILTPFSPVNYDTKQLVERVIKEHFRYLETASIEILFDQKKRKSNGNYVLASLKRPDDLTKFFTSKIANNGQGYDYILIIDENVFDVLEYQDKLSIIRFALQHADIDLESDTPYKLRKPDIQTFSEELKDNNTDFTWMMRVQVVAESIYNPKEEDPYNPTAMN